MHKHSHSTCKTTLDHRARRWGDRGPEAQRGLPQSPNQTGTGPSYLTPSPDVIQLQGQVVRDVAWEPQSLENRYLCWRQVIGARMSNYFSSGFQHFSLESQILNNNSAMRKQKPQRRQKIKPEGSNCVINTIGSRPWRWNQPTGHIMEKN